MKNRIIKTAMCIAAMHIANNSNAQTAGTTGRWDLRGNSTINTGLNFLGTIDAQDLNFRTNNIQRMNVNATTGNFGMGTTSTSDTKLNLTSTYGLTTTSTVPRTLNINNQHTGTNPGGTATQTGIECYVNGDNGFAPGNAVYGGKFNARTVRNNVTGLDVTALTFSPATAIGINVNTTSPDGGSGVYSVIGGATSGSTINQHAFYGQALAKPYSWAGWFQGNINVTDTGKIRRLSVGTTISSTANLLRVGSTTNDGISIGSAEFIQDAGANALKFNCSLWPNTNTIYNLGSSALRFNTVYATNGTINTSDRRDKTNIASLKYGLNEIMKLNPVSFTWKERSDEGTKLGLIAQELQTVLPEVVRDFDVVIDEATGKTSHIPAERLGVFYADIIPVLIKGMQEQQEQIEELKKIIEKLSSQDEAKNIKQDNLKTIQNFNLKSTPNPVGEMATISFELPQDFTSAQLTILNNAGQQVIAFNNLREGINKIELETKNMVAGNYIYSLHVNGKSVASKILSVVK